ncbi:hypothetical protein DUNSADRAFT_17301 [Dunaliella salina]|uniref:Uncharacterized protein n=1 Tax=Dunaliella salina TaxID=3046 RepID=A0ABQ7G1Z3_DUNSA|nr:hypothetical protein DUNSADRAFT_17301 [Dunaliella salina]|eukprot:KAF5828627.1 hypothetical protein DUNSADRAFT_17301 [Dunaliella salina]
MIAGSALEKLFDEGTLAVPAGGTPLETEDSMQEQGSEEELKQLQDMRFQQEVQNRIHDAYQEEQDQAAQLRDMQFQQEIQGRQQSVLLHSDDQGVPYTRRSLLIDSAHCVIVELDGSVNPGVHLRRDGRAQRVGFQSVSSKSIAHPKFQPGSFDYDIAALILDEPAEIEPAKLQAWIKEEVLGVALKEGPESVDQNEHDWSDTSLPPALQVQLAPEPEGPRMASEPVDSGLLDVLWDVGPFKRIRQG